MSRWRPPQARGSNYITPEGFERLKQELDALWKKRRKVTVILSAAAAEGDRSENAEYIYRKKQLREIDRRIRYLQKRLDELISVIQKPSDENVVYFGAWVTLEDLDSNEHVYRIVGPDEFDFDPRYISMDSPVAKALMKKTIDDEVIIKLPQGQQHYCILKIQYTDGLLGLA